MAPSVAIGPHSRKYADSEYDPSNQAVTRSVTCGVQFAISGAHSSEYKFCPTGITSFRFEEQERVVHVLVHVICVQDLAVRVGSAMAELDIVSHHKSMLHYHACALCNIKAKRVNRS